MFISDVQIQMFRFLFFYDFDPGPSLGVYREGRLTPWSRSSLLRSNEKVTGHSKKHLFAALICIELFVSFFAEDTWCSVVLEDIFVKSLFLV